MENKLAVWLIFSVLISFLPIVFNVIISIFINIQKPMKEVYENGELLLIAGTLCGAATGDLMASGRPANAYSIIAGGSCVAMLMLCSLLYAGIKFVKNSTSSSTSTLNIRPVVAITLILLVTGILCSTSCVLLSEIKP